MMRRQYVVGLTLFGSSENKPDLTRIQMTSRAAASILQPRQDIADGLEF